MSFTSALFGKKPSVPELTPLDLGKEQQLAIQQNISGLPAAGELASKTNLFNQQELTKMLEFAMPGYGSKKAKIGENITSMAAGEIPSDISEAVMRNANVRAMGGGYGGTRMAGNLTARDLGLTSLDLTQKGLDAASRWLSMTAPKQFDASSMFVTPNTLMDVAFRNTENQFQRDYVKNQTDAKYATGTIIGQSLINTDAQLAQIASSLAGSAAGAKLMCWVARECYGHDNPKWLLFRKWITTKAPKWLEAIYRKYGERFANYVHDKPRLKTIIRNWMDNRIMEAV